MHAFNVLYPVRLEERVELFWSRPIKTVHKLNGGSFWKWYFSSPICCLLWILDILSVPLCMNFATFLLLRSLL